MNHNNNILDYVYIDRNIYDSFSNELHFGMHSHKENEQQYVLANKGI